VARDNARLHKSSVPRKEEVASLKPRFREARPADDKPRETPNRRYCASFTAFQRPSLAMSFQAPTPSVQQYTANVMLNRVSSLKKALAS